MQHGVVLGHDPFSQLIWAGTHTNLLFK
jgi:hypothetical protein